MKNLMTKKRKRAFPVVNIEGNKVFTIDGVQSYFYKITVPDMYQKSRDDVERVYHSIGKFLLSLDTSEWVKYYSINGESYVSTKRQELNDFPLSTSEQDKPLDILFNGYVPFNKFSFSGGVISYDSRFSSIVTIKKITKNETDRCQFFSSYDYCLSVEKIPPSMTKARCKNLRRLNSISLESKHRDSESEDQYSLADHFLRELNRESTSEFNMNLSFLIHATSTEELLQKVQCFCSNLKNNGFDFIIEGNSFSDDSLSLGQSFISFIPGVTPNFSINNTPTFLGTVLDFLPLHKEKVHDRGLSFITKDGNEVYLDLKSKRLKNRNIVITGSTGSGKSVLTNVLIDLENDYYHTVVIEKGFSYKKNCFSHNGKIIEDKINPMFSRNPSFLKLFLLSCIEDGNFGKKESGMLYETIKQALDDDVVTFSQLINYLEDKFEGIKYYFSELMDYISDEEEDFVKFLYVDSSSIPKCLVKPLLVYLTEYCDQIIKRGFNLKFVIDEAKGFVKDSYELIDDTMRRIRKEGGLVVLVSQGASDVPPDMWNNAHIKISFPQSDSVLKGVSDFDRVKISELGQLKSEPPKEGDYSEFYISTCDDSIRKSIRLSPSQELIEKYHTEDKDDAFWRFVSQYGSFFNNNSDCMTSYLSLKLGGRNESFFA